MSDDYAFECDPSALEDIHTRTSAEDNSEDNDAAHAALESVQLELTEEKQLTFADSDSLIRARHSDGNAAERRLSGWKRKSDESSSTVSIVDDASKKQQKIGKESKLARPVRSVTIAPKSGSMTARSTVTASTQAAAAKAKAAAATVKDGSMTARGSVKEDAASVKDGSQTARSRGGATVVEVRSRYMHINRDKNSINAEKEAKVAKAALLAQQQQQKKLAERKIVTARRSMTASEITSAAAANKKRDDAKAEADVTAQSRRRSATTTELSAQVAKAAVPKLNFSGISAAVEEQKQDGWQYVAKSYQLSPIAASPLEASPQHTELTPALQQLNCVDSDDAIEPRKLSFGAALQPSPVVARAAEPIIAAPAATTLTVQECSSNADAAMPATESTVTVSASPDFTMLQQQFQFLTAQYAALQSKYDSTEQQLKEMSMKYSANESLCQHYKQINSEQQHKISAYEQQLTELKIAHAQETFKLEHRVSEVQKQLDDAKKEVAMHMNVARRASAFGTTGYSSAALLHRSGPALGDGVVSMSIPSANNTVDSKNGKENKSINEGFVDAAGFSFGNHDVLDSSNVRASFYNSKVAVGAATARLHSGAVTTTSKAGIINQHVKPLSNHNFS